MAKIMVVEDGKGLLKAVKSILEQELKAAPPGREENPRISGFEVSKYVKKLREGEDITVARFAPMGKKKILEVERGDAYLKKPLSRRELAEAVKELLGCN
jgi:CheY-like chemotaxis protein